MLQRCEPLLPPISKMDGGGRYCVVVFLLSSFSFYFHLVPSLLNPLAMGAHFLNLLVCQSFHLFHYFVHPVRCGDCHCRVAQCREIDSVKPLGGEVHSPTRINNTHTKQNMVFLNCGVHACAEMLQSCRLFQGPLVMLLRSNLLNL